MIHTHCFHLLLSHSLPPHLWDHLSQGYWRLPLYRIQWTLLSPCFLDLSWELPPLLLGTVLLAPEILPLCFSFLVSGLLFLYKNSSSTHPLKVAAQGFLLRSLSFPVLPRQPQPVSDFNYYLYVGNLQIFMVSTDFPSECPETIYNWMLYISTWKSHRYLKINIFKANLIIFTPLNPPPPGFYEINPGILLPVFHVWVHGIGIQSNTQTRIWGSS